MFFTRLCMCRQPPALFLHYFPLFPPVSNISLTSQIHIPHPTTQHHTRLAPPIPILSQRTTIAEFAYSIQFLLFVLGGALVCGSVIHHYRTHIARLERQLYYTTDRLEVENWALRLQVQLKGGKEVEELMRAYRGDVVWVPERSQREGRLEVEGWEVVVGRGFGGS